MNDITDGVYTPATEPGIPNVSVNIIQDSDADGVWDAGEPILATFSNTGGDYLFDSLLPGAYLAQVSDTLAVLRSFAISTLGPNPGQDFNNQRQPYSVTLSAGDTNTTADFGYREYEAFVQGNPPNPGVIGDLVWFDVKGDGVYTPAEGDQPIAGVTLALTRNGTPWATATTGGYGQYLFSDLPIGYTYTVRVTDAFGVLAGLQTAALGPNPGQNNNNQAQPYSVFLGVQRQNRTADFGYTLPSNYTVSKQLNTSDPLRPNSPISFTIRVTNTGNSWLTVLPLTDVYNTTYLTYGAGSRFASPDSADHADDGVLNWPDALSILGGGPGMLAPGAGTAITVWFTSRADTYALSQLGTLNTVTVTVPAFDPDGIGPMSAGTPLASRSASAFVRVLSPTGLTVTDFRATADRGRVTLTWQTANEAQLMGFHLRRETADGASQPVNDALLPAQCAGANQGATYTVTDAPAPGAYTYILEAVPGRRPARAHRRDPGPDRGAGNFAAALPAARGAGRPMIECPCPAHRNVGRNIDPR